MDAQELSAKQKTMGLSIREGSFAGISLVFSDNYIIPYALSLQASNIQVGLLSSMVGLLAPSAQILGSRMMEKHPRKRILVTGVFLQALMWLSFLSLGLLFLSNISIALLPVLLILFYMIYLTFGNVAGPSWFSLMGDIVPENQRGRYFARRSLITLSIALASTLCISFFLDYSKTSGYLLYGFCIIFIVALICRSISARYLSKHYYPPFPFEKSQHVSLTRFIKNLPKENFGHFTMFVALINFGQMIAGPFFSVYMLEDLNFDYTIFTIITLSASFFGLLIFPLIGKSSDKFGNVEMLRIGAIMLPIIPLLWLVPNPPVIYLILVAQLVSGIGWTTFNLSASNFIYDCVSCQQRGLYIAYYNFIIGIGIFCGGITGSLILSYLPITFMNQFLFLFLISGIIRGIAVAILLFRIKEVRPVQHLHFVFNFRHFNIHKWLFENIGHKHPKNTNNHSILDKE
jgi:MFS family permease